MHAPYVINVASPNNRIRIPSRKLLQQIVDGAAAVGATGVVVHGGHVTAKEDPEKGFDNWRKAIDALQTDVTVYIENTAGGDFSMARRLDRIEGLWAAVQQADGAENVGFCLDTCHAWAGGIDLTTAVADVRAITGRVDLVHLNNSRDTAGSGADRHAGLTAGTIDPELPARGRPCGRDVGGVRDARRRARRRRVAARAARLTVADPRPIRLRNATVDAGRARQASPHVVGSPVSSPSPSRGRRP